MRDPKTAVLGGFPQTPNLNFRSQLQEVGSEVAKKNGSFVKLPYALLDSDIWNNLSRPGRDAYISIKRMKYKRDAHNEPVCTNWDFIPFGYSDLIVPMDKKTFVLAIEELRCTKLIKLEVPGGFPRKKGIYSLGLFRK